MKRINKFRKTEVKVCFLLFVFQFINKTKIKCENECPKQNRVRKFSFQSFFLFLYILLLKKLPLLSQHTLLSRLRRILKMEIIGKEGSFFLGPGPQNKMRVPFYSRLSLKPECWKKKNMKSFCVLRNIYSYLLARKHLEKGLLDSIFYFIFFQTRTKFREENQVFVSGKIKDCAFRILF